MVVSPTASQWIHISINWLPGRDENKFGTNSDASTVHAVTDRPTDGPMDTASFAGGDV